MAVELMPHQKAAIEHLSSGKVLWGGVGAGKSMTVLAWYVENLSDHNIVVITTAKKRDTLDWQGEAAKFGIGAEEDATVHGTIFVDSWNNIGKYTEYTNTFFIFDEQRVVGTGSWVKSFIKIARNNPWILLTATPGDVWLDYAPIFIANGYYKNITEFKWKHVIYEAFAKYPKVKGYINESKLELLRNEVLVEMPYLKHTTKNTNWMDVSYDESLYTQVVKNRWHVYEDRPLKDISEMFRVMRKVVNTDPSRLEMVHCLMKCHPRLVIFYNFNYELEILRSLSRYIGVFEWNGHQKDPVPQEDRWVYLVQYVAGAEAWNCTSTNAMILYSLTYSYKNFVQAQGRIDRLDTEFDVLYYYMLTSNSTIDLSVRKSLGQKRSFNEKKFITEGGEL